MDSIQQDSKVQSVLSNTFLPYEGADSYIFVSYSKINKDRVIPILTALHERGYRIWYDAGIHVGDKWPAEIANHVEQCAVFMPFYTQAFNDSDWCHNEITHALHHKKIITGVSLEDVRLKPEIEIQIRRFQNLKFYDSENKEAFLTHLTHEPNLISCLDQEKFQRWSTARAELKRKAQEEAARQEADRLAREAAERQEAERKARERAARQEAERRAQEEAARQEAERKAQAEAARQEAERKAREEAARQEAERKARAEVARQEAERKAREEAERKETEKRMREENSERRIISMGMYFSFIKQKDSSPRMVKFWRTKKTSYETYVKLSLALLVFVLISAYFIFTHGDIFFSWFVSWNLEQNGFHILVTIGTLLFFVFILIAFCARLILSWSETIMNNRKLKDWERIGLTMRSLMGIGDVSCISVGKGKKPFVVGVFDDNTADGRGDNSDGQLNVAEWKNIETVSAGYNHTVALCQDGTVLAVGDNSYGKCNISDWKDIVAVSAGGNHTVGLRRDGTVVAVGDNTYHQLEVKKWHDIKSISAGWNHTIGLCKNGKVFAMGEDADGQIDVSRWENIAMVSAGYDCTVGLSWDGKVVTAGDISDDHNSYNQATFQSGVVAVAAGYKTILALYADGSIGWIGHQPDYHEYPCLNDRQNQ